MRLLRIHTAFAICATMFTLVLGGCAGAETPPKIPVASATTRGVSLRVEVTGDERRALAVNATRTRVTERLRGLGYTLVEGPTADVAVKVDIALKERPLPLGIQIQINGKQNVSYDAIATLRASAEGDPSLAGAVVVFDAEENGPSGADVDGLLRPLLGPRLAQWAGQREERTARRAREEREAEAERRRQAAAALAEQAAQEDLAWNAASPQRCEEAADDRACAPLDAFLVKWPNGRHAKEAAAARKVGGVRLAARRDETAWAAASPARCKRPTVSDDCAGVERYLASHADGSHADEARRLATASAPSIERLRRSEQATAEREATRASAQEESGGWDGGSYSGGGRRSSGGGSTHVSGYTRKDGTQVRSHTRRGRR